MLLTYGAYRRLHTLNQMNLRGRVNKKPEVSSKKNFVSYILRRLYEDMNCQNYSLNFRQVQFTSGIRCIIFNRFNGKIKCRKLSCMSVHAFSKTCYIHSMVWEVVLGNNLNDVCKFFSFKGRFLEFRMYHNFANLFSKLSESTFTSK